MKTLKEVAENGTAYRVPFGHEDIRAAFLACASEQDVSVEELLHWACAHIGHVRTQFHDEDKHWTTEDTLDMLALAIVKLRFHHPSTAAEPLVGFSPLKECPETRGLAERIEHFEGELA
jgi:hypothetical protein